MLTGELECQDGSLDSALKALEQWGGWRVGDARKSSLGQGPRAGQGWQEGVRESVLTESAHPGQAP